QPTPPDSNTLWEWVGKGDVLKWLKQPDEAAAAYEQVLELDPFADVARLRLIDIYTTQARRQAGTRSWHQALATLKKILNGQTPESWIPYQKEAYVLRSEIYIKMNQPEKAKEYLYIIILTAP